MITYFKSLSPAAQAVLIATASALAGAGALWAWQYYTEDEKVVLFKKSLKEQQKSPAMDEKVLKELSDKVLAATADVVKMALKEAEQAAAAAKAAPAAAAPAAAAVG